MPGSYQAIYNASKSFIQSFAEALQDELRDRDITITSLMPGPTATEFFERADMADNTRMGKGPQDDPADVARQGYEGLNKGEKRVVAASLLTKASEAMNKVMPDRIKAVTNRLGAEPLDD
jgi:short-subunit dehydrogenase